MPGGKTWAAPDFDARAWPAMNLPGAWEATPALAGYDGVVWFRKEIDLTAADAGRALTLALGPIDDADSTWFNGVKVGGTTGYAAPRAYTVPAALVRPGRNVIAVRVVDTGGGGGFVGNPDALRLTTAGRTLRLAGPWQYQVGIAPKDVPRSPIAGGAQNAPTTLYNGMIAPVLPFAIKGVIWYQGESNADRADQYRTLFPALIAGWRTRWGYAFPFLFVQLANFQPALPRPGRTGPSCAKPRPGPCACPPPAWPRPSTSATPTTSTPTTSRKWAAAWPWPPATRPTATTPWCTAARRMPAWPWRAAPRG